MPSSLQPPASSLPPRGFTLVELLITVAIIAIMAGMILFAMYRAQETAKQQKTRALVAKLDAVIKSKWESYKTRRVPVTIPPLTDPRDAARMRLDALRDLMRMELPDRYSDIVGVVWDNARNNYIATSNPVPPVAGIPTPAVSNAYFRRVSAAVATGTTPDIVNQGAEMLYLIATASLADDAEGRDVFKADNVGDTDEDGMLEFIDGWGRPIKFLRWAPGIQSDLHVLANVVVMSEITSASTSKITIGPPSSASLSASAGLYVGGAIGVLDDTGALNPAPIDGRRMARITGYAFDTATGTATFTCTTPSGQDPFNGSPPIDGDRIVILAPDPFDPLGVYPTYGAGDDFPNFAIMPLIYSAGPDGSFGTLADIDDNDNAGGPIDPYSYPTNNLDPFIAHMSTMPQYLMFGASATLTNESPGAALDNIHNHTLGLR